MSDIRTVQEVRIDDFKVRLAKQETQDRYDAAVIAMKKSAPTKLISSAFGDKSEWSAITDAPIADHDQKYVAVGKAVEEFLDMEEDDE